MRATDLSEEQRPSRKHEARQEEFFKESDTVGLDDFHKKLEVDLKKKKRKEEKKNLHRL